MRAKLFYQLCYNLLENFVIVQTSYLNLIRVFSKIEPFCKKNENEKGFLNLILGHQNFLDDLESFVEKENNLITKNRHYLGKQERLL